MREVFYYKLHRGQQVRHLFEPLRVGLLRQRLLRPGQYQDATATERFRGKDIAHPVAHPPAPIERDPEALSGLPVEEGSRLPALAGTIYLGKVRAEIVGGEPAALLREQLVQPLFRQPVLFLSEETSGNP